MISGLNPKRRGRPRLASEVLLPAERQRRWRERLRAARVRVEAWVRPEVATFFREYAAARRISQDHALADALENFALENANQNAEGQ